MNDRDIMIFAVWGAGAFIGLIITGYIYANSKDDNDMVAFGFMSLLWPAAVFLGLVFLLIFSPFWMGKKTYERTSR